MTRWAGWIGVLTAAAVWSAEELPTGLKEELTRIETRLTEMKGRIGTVKADAIELSLKEVEQWVSEFVIDAELLDDSMILRKLRDQIASLRQQASASPTPSPAMKPAATTKSTRTVTAEELNVDPPVDLDNVSFKKDVAPILQNVCCGCHNPQRKSGKFDASTYEGFVSMLTPGDPAGSHVLDLVTGKASPRMPQGGMRRFEKRWVDIWTAWIKQGAKFDGTSRSAPLTAYMIDWDVQRRATINKMSDDQLEKLHLAHADRQMTLVAPKRSVNEHQTENFLVRTTLSAEDAEYTAVLAEAVLEELQKNLGERRQRVIFRGKMGLNVFADRFDYLAFAKQVDDQEPEATVSSHVRIRPEHQYAAVGIDRNVSLDSQVVYEVARAYFLQLGDQKMPAWAVHGLARMTAEDFEPRGVKRNQEEIAQAKKVAQSKSTLADLFADKLPWVDASAVSTCYFRALHAANKKTVWPYAAALAKTGSHDKAKTVLGSPSNEQLTTLWQGWLSKHAKGK